MKRHLIALLSLLCLAFCPAPVSAATLTSVTITQTSQVDGELFVYFDTKDEKDLPVSGLTDADVSLSVGAVRLQSALSAVSSFDGGIGYVFVVDISKSLRESQFNEIKNAITTWVDSMGENDRAAILTFGNEITLLTDFTDNAQALKASIEALGPTDDDTPLYSAILKALDIAKRQSETLPAKRAVIILSDGINTTTTGVSVAELTQKAAAAGIPIYGLGIQESPDRDALNALGSVIRASGGDFYIGTTNELAAGYQQIYNRIQGSYVLTSQLHADIADGSTQGLVLSVTQDHITVEDSADIRLKTFLPPDTPAPSLAPSTPLPATPAAPATPTGIGAAERPPWLAACVIGGGILLLLLILWIGKRKKHPQQVVPAKTTPKADRAAAYKSPAFPGSRGKLMLIQQSSGAEHIYAAPLKRQISVGRRTVGNDIVLYDKCVSAKHCLFEVCNTGIYLKDCNSRKGTFLVEGAGKRVRITAQGIAIQDGSHICLGDTLFTVRFSSDEPANRKR